MSSLKNSLAVAGALAAQAYAHGLVSGFTTDGVFNQGYILDYYYAKINTGTFPATAGWYEEATDNGFIAPSAYGSPDIICHKNAQNAKISATVKAGGTVDFHWAHSWPDSHFGPIMTYVANCGAGADACSTVDKTTLEWVKIDEAAIDLATQTWPIAAMIKNNNTWSITVPPSLVAGNYVFRHEIIAMHGAESPNGAQNYPFCMNIAITGGGSDKPAGTLGTALYNPNEPGILFNPYTKITNYTKPGPALFAGGTDSSKGTSVSSSSSPPTTGGSGSSAPGTPTGSASGAKPTSASSNGSGSNGSGSNGSKSNGSSSSGSKSSGSTSNGSKSSGSNSGVGSAAGSTPTSGCHSAGRGRRRHARAL